MHTHHAAYRISGFHTGYGIIASTSGKTLQMPLCTRKSTNMLLQQLVIMFLPSKLIVRYLYIKHGSLDCEEGYFRGIPTLVHSCNVVRWAGILLERQNQCIYIYIIYILYIYPNGHHRANKEITRDSVSSVRFVWRSSTHPCIAFVGQRSRLLERNVNVPGQWAQQ